MIRCIIVDDEPLAQEVIENYICRFADLECAGICKNALDAFTLLHQEQIDLMFLDIKMPGINGLDFFRSLKNPPAVIFTTAFASHAVEGFELDAVDYLLKPITFERFQKSINKFLKIQTIEQQQSRNYCYFKISGRLVKMLYADILYAHSVKDYIQLCTPNKNYLTHMTMKYLCDLLPADTFIRVHRSYLVNKNHINTVETSAIKIGGDAIPVGNNYKSNLDDL
ncbi:LytR/AlgR family response regulator transcription factor [Mucilaginibacter calamicampi]|uniref:LytR/AlgR family response regulator transcription factor n=1 Tax=Mucilaginibacter calamicampi TaxID=1302352 RepID=A0ABW2YTJ9_9SPHI